MSDVLVEVPARPDFVGVLRTIVASVAARLNFTYEAIDDLRIAVDEACGQLLSVARPGARLTLRITPDGNELSLTASAEAAPGAWPPPGSSQTMAWQILTALADDVRFGHDGDSPALFLRKRGLESA